MYAAGKVCGKKKPRAASGEAARGRIGFMSVKDMFKFGKNSAAFLGSGSYSRGAFKRFYCLFLRGVEVLRNVHHYIDQFVAGASVVLVRKAFSAETQHFARLCACRNVDAGASGDGGDFY